MKLNYLLLHIINIFFGFSHCVGFVFLPIYISVKQEAMAGSFHVHNHPGVFNFEYEWEHTWDILLKRISRGGNSCVQRIFKKNIYFIMIFHPILNPYCQFPISEPYARVILVSWVNILFTALLKKQLSYSVLFSRDGDLFGRTWDFPFSPELEHSSFRVSMEIFEKQSFMQQAVIPQRWIKKKEPVWFR